MEGHLEAMILNCNKLAMEQLRGDQFDTALGLLKKAEDHLGQVREFPNHRKLEAITLNNLGCFYKRIHRPAVALHYLRRALEVESTPPADIPSLAGTHLNICAIRSGLGAHEKALEHARKAIRLLASGPEDSPNTYTSLVIAYHNAGIEYEFLGKHNEATECFTQGYSLAKRRLGAVHPLTQNLKRATTQLALEQRSERNSNRSLAAGRGEEMSPRGSDLRPQSYGQRRSPFTKALPRIATAPRKKKRRKEAAIQPAEFTLFEEPKPPSPQSSVNSLLNGGVRYLSGDRLKPMTRESSRDKSRPKSRDISAPPPPSAPRPQSKSFRTRGLEAQHSGNLHDAMESRLQNINAKLSKLQSALQQFEESSQRTKVAAEGQQVQAAIRIQRAIRRFLNRCRRLKKVVAKPIPVPKPPSQPRNSAHFKRKPLPSSLFPIQEKDKSETDYIILIQSRIRGYLLHKAFQRMRRAAICIQKHIRGLQCRRLYVCIRAAVLFIQAAVRGWLLRRSLV
jgi:tetratricopeptide (TPR) repeat protein